MAMIHTLTWTTFGPGARVQAWGAEGYPTGPHGHGGTKVRWVALPREPQYDGARAALTVLVRTEQGGTRTVLVEARQGHANSQGEVWWRLAFRNDAEDNATRTALARRLMLCTEYRCEEPGCGALARPWQWTQGLQMALRVRCQNHVKGAQRQEMER